MSGMVSIAGMVVFMVLLISSRILGERALSGLTKEEKLRLLDGFSRHRAYVLVPMFGLLLLTLVALQAMPSRARDIARLDLLFTVLMMGVIHVVMMRKLDALSLPRAYVRRWLVARALNLVGVVILFGSVAYSSLAAR